MHIGLVASSDIDASFDLANAFISIGMKISLYLPFNNVAQALNRSKFPQEIISRYKLLDPSINIRLIDYPRARNLRSLTVIQQIYQMMLKDGIEIVHILGGPGEIWLSILACIIKKIPVVSTMIIPSPNIGDDMPSMVGRITNRILCFGSREVIVNGKDQEDWVKKIYRVPADRLTYIPLCPRVTSTKWIQYRVPQQPETLLFFGRAALHKGLEYLIKAERLITEKIPNAHFILACHGKDLKRCRTFIQNENQYEIYEGFVPGELMAEFYQRASLVVLPYLTASTSGVLLTAYEFGKPVVATKVGSLPEYVKDGKTGILVEPRNENQLAKAIVEIFKDEENLHQMGRNAQNWMKELKADVINQNLNVYQKVISLLH